MSNETKGRWHPARRESDSPAFELRKTLGLCIASLFISAVVVWLLSLSQSIECLVVLIQDAAKAGNGHRARVLYLFLTSTLLSCSLWYWARALQYAFLFTSKRPFVRVVRSWFPRVVAIVPLAGLTSAFLNQCYSVVADRRDCLIGGALGWGFLILTVSLPLLWSWRRRLLQIGWFGGESGGEPGIGNLPRFSQSVLLISAILSLIVFSAFALNSQLAEHFGALSVMLLAASAWAVFLNLAAYIKDKRNWPIFWMLAAWVSLWSFLQTNDNHTLRHSVPTKIVESSSRNTLEDDFNSWLRGRPDKAVYKDEMYPVVIVATEGGGIYAAYHTALVLSKLQDKNPSFSQHIFAISGVSGGSLGAALFAAVCHEHGPRNNGQVASNAKFFEGATKAFFKSDFLSPLIASATYPDLVARLSPVSIPSFDRARALESSIERAWDRTASEISNRGLAVANPFKEDFQSLWLGPNASSVPGLMLNTTEVESGRQLVLSNLGVSTFSRPQSFFREHPQSHYRLSTAALLSARFPIITPAGLEPNGKSGPHRYVDGGYFDNSGTEAAADVVAAILNLKRPVELVVIRIGLEEKAKSGFYHAETAFGEIGSPIRAMLNTRGARSDAAVSRVHSMTDRRKDCKFFESMLLNDPPLPLGWLLSDRGKTEIQNKVDDVDGEGEVQLEIYDAIFPSWIGRGD